MCDGQVASELLIKWITDTMDGAIDWKSAALRVVEGVWLIRLLWARCAKSVPSKLKECVLGCNTVDIQAM